MRYVEVNGVRVSAIGLGTWQFGSWEWGYGDAYARREAFAIVRRALDLRINLVDTAEIYAFGRSERVVGEAIAGRRDTAFVATKVFPVLPLAVIFQVVSRRHEKKASWSFVARGNRRPLGDALGGIVGEGRRIAWP